MNLSVDEYLLKLDAVADCHGADPRTLKSPERHWSAVLGGVSVTVGLKATSHLPNAAWVPEVRIGSSATLPTDALAAMAQLDDMTATLRRAMVAWASLTRCRVYWGDVPCGNCSGAGKTYRGTCDRCGGSGVRLRASKEGGG